jgi:hypothetical protein
MIDRNVAQKLNTISLIPMADITASGDGTGVDITQFVGEGKFVLSAKNVAGTTPTLDVKLQHSADNITYADVTGGAFTQVTDADTRAAVQHTLDIKLDGLNKYVRAVKTIGGTDTPQFLVFCVGLGVKQIR